MSDSQGLLRSGQAAVLAATLTLAPGDVTSVRQTVYLASFCTMRGSSNTSSIFVRLAAPFPNSHQTQLRFLIFKT